MNLSLALLLTPSEGASGSIVPQLFMYGAIFAIFYLILIRPQQKQRRAQNELLNTLKKGDEIVTAGGIVGEVVHIKESLKDGQPVRSAEDRVTVKSGESRFVMERGRVARIISRGGGTNGGSSA